MKRHLILAILILASAFAVRAVVARGWESRIPEGQQFVFPDSESYWHLAGTIAAGQTYQFGNSDARIFRAPVYPWVLSWCVPNVRAARWLSVSLGLAVVFSSEAGGIYLNILLYSERRNHIICTSCFLQFQPNQVAFVTNW